jgi:hypothetical protein
MTQFYSYLWLREDGTPYYVGKGSGSRAFITADHGVHRPKDRSRILICPQLNEAEAFESEMAIIALFGRKDLGTGCLRNMTPGGEGTIGYHHTPEAKAAIVASLQGNKRGVGNKNMLGQHHTPETKAKMAAKKIGNKNGFGNPELAEKRAAQLRGVPRDPEVHKKMWEARRLKPMPSGWKRSPEASKKTWDTRFLKTVAYG